MCQRWYVAAAWHVEDALDWDPYLSNTSTQFQPQIRASTVGSICRLTASAISRKGLAADRGLTPSLS